MFSLALHDIVINERIIFQNALITSDDHSDSVITVVTLDDIMDHFILSL